MVLVALALLLIGGVSVEALLTSRHAARDRRLDRAALRAVSLLTVDHAGPLDVPADRVPMGLHNAGPAQVLLLSAQLDAPGYPVTPESVLLPAGRSVPFLVAASPTCVASLPFGGATGLRVEIRTGRGDRRTMVLPLDPAGAGGVVAHDAQQRCGLLPVGDSLAAVAQDGRLVDGVAVLDLQLSNRSVLPLSLVAVHVAPGLAARLTPDPPPSLPAAGQPQAQGPVRAVQVRVRTTSCRLLLQADNADNGELSPTTLGLVVARGIERGDPGFAFTGRAQNALFALVQHCREATTAP